MIDSSSHLHPIDRNLNNRLYKIVVRFVNSVRNLIKGSKRMDCMIYIFIKNVQCWTNVRNVSKWSICGNWMIIVWIPVSIVTHLENVVDVKRQWIWMNSKYIRRSRIVRFINNLHQWVDVHCVIMTLKRENKESETILCNKVALSDDHYINIYSFLDCLFPFLFDFISVFITTPYIELVHFV